MHCDTGEFNVRVVIAANRSTSPPTPTTSGAARENDCITGVSSSCAYITLLSIDSAEPVSTSASATRTPPITAFENSWPALLQVDATAPEVNKLAFATFYAVRVGQTRAMWPTPPQA